MTLKKIFHFIIVGMIFFQNIFFVSALCKEFPLNCCYDNNFNKIDFLIILPSDLSHKFEPLVIHKEHYGIVTKIVSLDDIYNSVYFPVKGRDNPERIKYFIKEAKENWNINYVLLVGGQEKMPVRYIPKLFELKSFFISDLYYADLYDEEMNFCSWDTNNNSRFGELAYDRMIDYRDLYPDVHIGRILCDTSNEVEYMVNQIIEYETNTFGEEWFNNIVVCGGNTKPFYLDLIYGGKHGGEIVNEGEYICDEVADILHDFNPIKLYASTFSLSKRGINDAINDGAGFVLFSGHGSSTAWGTYPLLGLIPLPFPNGYTVSDSKNIENENNLSIMVFNACSCGDFRKRNPIAWEIIVNGGAIASLACTTESVSQPSTLCIETLSGWVTVNFFNTYKNGTGILGNVYSETIENYLNDDSNKIFFSNGSHYQCMEYWMLFGDPTLKIGGYNN
jgi:hypothetical protein